MMKRPLLTLCTVLLAAIGARAQSVIGYESFEGSGVEAGYTSTTFDGRTASPATPAQYFVRAQNTVTGFGSSPASVIGNTGGTLPAGNGSWFWASEGARGQTTANPRPVQTVTTNNIPIAGYNNIKVRVSLADARGTGYVNASPQWESDDHVRIKVSVDGGSFNTVADFGGNIGPTTASYLTQITPTTGATAGAQVTQSFQDFTYDIAGTGSNIRVQVEVDQIGGTEELAFDNLRVLGTAAASAAPVLANVGSGFVTYNEGDPATQVTSTITVSDTDSPNLTGATIAITNGNISAQDVLAATAPGGSNITVQAYNAGTGTLTLSGTSSLANYQLALRSVTYRNTDGTTATGGLRDITFTVTDGANTSNAQIRQINVVAQLNGPSSLPYLEDFETNGEGTRYTANAWTSTSPCLGFTRTNQNPYACTPITFGNVSNSYYWYAESTNSPTNPYPTDIGTMVLAPVNATNYGNLTFNIRMATGQSAQWENDDYVKFFYRVNGGSWVLFSAFYGNGTSSTGGELQRDTDLNGAADSGSGTVTLNSTMQNVPLALPAAVTGASVDFMIEVSNDGQEELAFDRIQVTGVLNNAPTISNQTRNIAENSANGTNVGAAIVASDVDGNSLTYAITGGNTNGAFAINSSTGQITVANSAALNYEATQSYSLTVQVTDNGTPAASSSATVTVNVLNVNEAPTAVNDSFTVAEDSGATVLNVLGNDSDPDAGTTLTVISITQPANGTVTLVGGVVRFTPAANFNGTTTFTYTISDGVLTSTATVTMTVTPVNDPPTAVNDSFTVNQNSSATVFDVLANDSSAPDTGETLTVTGVTQPANGTVTLTSGVVRFTPAAGFAGTTSFTYTISDGNGGTATGTVTVTVNDVTAPTVTITSSGNTNGGSTSTSPIPFTVTFSENVTGFVQGDLNVAGGTVSGFTAVNGTTYTFNVTPSGNGTVTVNLSANVAQDAAGNNNTAASQFSITYQQPVVATAQNVTVNLDANGNATLNASSVNNGSTGGGTLTYTIQKIVYGKVSENQTLTLTTPNGANFQAIRFASYGTPIDNGNGNYRVNNNCNAANSVTTANNSFVGRSTGSMDALNGPGAPNNNPQLGDPCPNTPKSLAVVVGYSPNAASLTYTCNEANQTNYVLLTVSDGTTTSTSVAQVTVNPSPTATLSNVSPNPALRGATVTVSGTNLSGATSLTVNGAPATISGLSGTGFTFVVPNTASFGTGTISVTAPCSQTVTSSFTVEQPQTATPVVLTPANGSFTNDNTPTFTGTAVAGSNIFLYVDGVFSDTTFANAAGNWRKTRFTPLADGSHTVYVTAQASGQAVSNNSNTNTFVVDTVRPTVALSSTGNTNGGTTTTSPIQFTVTFSENVTGFVAGDLTVSNGTVSGFTGSGTTYTFSVTPTTAGTATTVNVPANVAQDAASNGNTAASAAYAVTFQAPTITVAPASLPNGTQGTAYSVTFSASGGSGTYTYAVTAGALPAGLSLSGATLSGTPTASGTFNFTVTATDSSAAPGPYSGSRTYSFIIDAPTSTVWTGNTNTDWFTAGNWSTSSVPTNTLDVTIPTAPSGGRFPNISAGVANARNLTLNSGATLSQSAGTLLMAGSLTNNGTYQPTGGTVSLGASAAANILGSSSTRFWNLTVGSNGVQVSTSAGLAVRRLLTLNGSLTTNGNPVTLESNTTLTAMVVNNGAGVISGNVTVQRYISTSNAGAGYRHYSSPVSNATVGDLATAGFTPVVNPQYNTAAQPGLVTPFPNVYGYDQSRLGLTNDLDFFSKGWFSPNALSDALTVGKGYSVNTTGGQTFAVTGPQNNGTYTQTLARGPQRGTPDQSGWHLVGNPYPSPLDYSQVAPADRVNLDGAIYVFASNGQYTGNYAFYNNGIGTISPVLAQGQGFFTRVSNGQTSGSLTLRNSQRPTTYQNPAYNRTSTQRPLVQLDLQGANHADPLFVYFEQGATAGMDSEFDAVKLPNTHGLNLSAVAGTDELAINGLPLPTGSNNVTVPLQVRVPATGTYTLHAASIVNLPAGMVAYLRDLQTGAVQDLSQQPDYTFALNAAYTGVRFELFFTPQRVTAVAPASLAAQVAVFPNPAHKAVFVELPATLTRSATTVALVDALGRTVLTQQLTAASTQLSLEGVATGVYALRLHTAQGTVTKKLTVE